MLTIGQRQQRAVRVVVIVLVCAACVVALAGFGMLAARVWRRLGELTEDHLFARLFDPTPYGEDWR